MRSALPNALQHKKRREPKFRSEEPSREWHEERRLFRVADGPALTDDRDADLAGIGKVFFNLAGDALTEHVGLIVIHVFGIDHDADFASGLNGVRFGYSVEAMFSKSSRRLT